ncbi:hypothetical protein NE237_000699 [Protea cynaroides]|uniref:Vesicle-fusing ATPase n=1 Tax=Protea cynaroides TaxID=273540 RepID=A0A9Q0KRS0_9MAGN|nr:hypothetical protein NE237_000699 [Protea cynaroides]
MPLIEIWLNQLVEHLVCTRVPCGTGHAAYYSAPVHPRHGPAGLAGLEGLWVPSAIAALPVAAGPWGKAEWPWLLDYACEHSGPRKKPIETKVGSGEDCDIEYAPGKELWRRVEIESEADRTILTNQILGALRNETKENGRIAGTDNDVTKTSTPEILAENEEDEVDGSLFTNKHLDVVKSDIEDAAEGTRLMRLIFTDIKINGSEEDGQFSVVIKKPIASRGSTRNGTRFHDSIVNQLLTKIDGVEAFNNILLIGVTNRKDLLDGALLWLWHLEIHVEIRIPDEAWSFQILDIHTNIMKENSFIAPDVDFQELSMCIG